MLRLKSDHRVICGDCTNRDVVARLMGGEKADMVFTDPPYNVGFDYNQHDDTEVSKDEWRNFSRACHDQWLALSDRIIVTPGCNNLEIWCQVAPNIAHIAPWIKKNGQTTGRVTHFWNWEPIIFIGTFKRKRPNDIFEHHVMSGFLRKQQEAPVLKGQHPCPKPLSLWLDIVESFSDVSEILLDPFLGSGSTVIACEKTNRRCFGSEIDPVYVDVICQRFHNFCAKPIIRERDGFQWAS